MGIPGEHHQITRAPDLIKAIALHLCRDGIDISRDRDITSRSNQKRNPFESVISISFSLQTFSAVTCTNTIQSIYNRQTILFCYVLFKLPNLPASTPI